MAVPHAQLIPSIHTFLVYETPVVMRPDEPDPPREKSLEYLKFWLFRTSDMRFIPDPRLVDYIADYKKCKRNEMPPLKNTRTFLEGLFPTKYWMENGIRYKQKVSREQATRPVLLNIHNKLELEMERREASKVSSQAHNYCPIRYTLHMELFDEMIRQVTLECRFRGYLLNRIRGELYETLDAYKTLLHTSLVEDSRTDSIDQVDPEILSLRSKLAILESEYAVVKRERFDTGCDYKEICDKLDMLDRIRTQLHEPEIEFTKRIQHAMELQKHHFENPPTFEEEEPEKVLFI